MSKRDETRRFSPVEVLVVVFVFLFALAVLVPATQMPRFEEYRTKCADNLSQIGRATLLYANDYDDELPRSGGRNSTWAPTIPNWSAYNRSSAYGISADGSGGLASISSCFYLLVKYAGLMPGTFVCPGDVGTTEFQLSDVGAGSGELIDFWDFGPDARKHCSYAYHMPFGVYALNMSDDPGLAVAADRNPLMDSPAATAKEYPGIFVPEGGREAVKYGNAIAHEEEGQNVLFLDFHVSFEDHSFCGIHDDNIYTYWDGGDIRMGAPPALGSQSMDRIDSLLVHDPIPPVGTPITREPASVDSADLKQTSIVATLDSPLPKYRNVIWCSSFQMAWGKLENDIIGEPVEVPGAEKLADSLNRADVSDKDIDEESYFATAGLLKDGIIEQIQQEMAQRFPSEPAPVFDDMNGLPPEAIIAFSYLNGVIEFEYPFYVNNSEFDFQDSNSTITKVTSFCTRSDSDRLNLVREQVDILYYKQDDQTNETGFAVDLCKYTNPYQVVLACVPQQKNLGKTVAYVEQKISEYMQDPNYEELRKLKPAIRTPSGSTFPADSLIVPDVLFKLTHHFAELEGRAIGNRPWLDQAYSIGKAMQMIDFTPGRTGVILKLTVPPVGPHHEPRLFHFDRPFLIYIKKREPAASPFFVLWVDNAELMQGFQVESPD
jgi:type II secretory pathway pseudopilin PulG